MSYCGSQKGGKKGIKDYFFISELGQGRRWCQLLVGNNKQVRCGERKNGEEFNFGHVDFEVPAKHSRKNVLQTI